MKGWPSLPLSLMPLTLGRLSHFGRRSNRNREPRMVFLPSPIPRLMARPSASALGGPKEHLSRPGGGHGPALVDDLPIDDDVGETGRVLVGLLERRHVPDPGRIEHRDVRLHAGTQDAPVGKAD